MIYTVLIVAISWTTLASSLPFESRIINGVNAPNTPWVARIVTHYEKRPVPGGTETRISSNCGGSLVAPHWVLSARHCVMNDQNKLSSDQFFASVGDVNYVNGQIIRVTVIHLYNARDNSDDIAMLRLARDVTNIRPIPVQFQNNIDYGGKWATIYGWGQTETGKGSQVLKMTNVALWDRNNCQQNSICLNPEVTNSNACSGDSGGPMVMNVGGQTRLVGVTRAVLVVNGVACKGNKAFYTSTSYYANWIAATMRL